MLRQLLRQDRRQRTQQRDPPVGPPLCPQVGAERGPRQQIDRHRLPLAPVGADLKDGGAGQAAMREKEAFLECDPPAADPRRHRYARKVAQRGQFLLREGQRHQRRPRVGHPKAELFRDPVGKPRRPHLGDRLAARGQNQPRRPHRAARGLDHEIAVPLHRLDGRRQPQLHPRLGHLPGQHRHDLLGAAIAEKLAQGLFMPGDPGPVNAGDESGGRKAPQGRDRKARVGRQEPFLRRLEIGEIAPPAARDADLLPRCGIVVDDQDRAPPAPRLDRAHHARGPRPQNDDINPFHGPRLGCFATPGNAIFSRYHLAGPRHLG